MKFFITILFLSSIICYVSMVIVKNDDKVLDEKNEKSGLISNHDHEESKKGEEIKENKKVDYSDDKFNKKSHYKEEEARKSVKAHHENKHGKKHKKKAKRKKTGFRKGFHDKYHFDEEKKGKKFWGSTNSQGKYITYKKKSKNNIKKNNEHDKLNNGIKIERNFPGERFVEITWRN